MEPTMTRPVGLVRHSRASLAPADAALAQIIREVVQERLAPSVLARSGVAHASDRPLVALATPGSG
jgi:DNA-binding TFAR19-related protein (PDSD5 family)